MPMSTFLVPYFRESHFFDVRTSESGLTKDDLFNVIEETKLDMVVMTYWPHMLTSSEEATAVNPYTD